MKNEGTTTNLIKKRNVAVQGNSTGTCRTDPKLEIPPGGPDIHGLRSVAHEWLVPRLVQEFLRERGVELKQKPMPVKQKNEISNAPSRGGRGASRREQ